MEAVVGSMSGDELFWKNKKVLITGHTGFKGSWLVMLLKKYGADISGYSLAPPTTPNLFETCSLEKEIEHHISDLRETQKLQQVIAKFQPQMILHLAAQPLVRESYRDPMDTYSVNAMGTCSLLEAVRQNRAGRESSKLVLINVTTDKVYENRETLTPYQESDRLGGFDPYSNSKACSELITQSYRDSFFSPSRISEHQTVIATARAGNVIGGGDWSLERLVPDYFRALKSHAALQIRFPDAVRPWQHVLECLTGYLKLAQKLWLANEAQVYQHGASWNFGPPAEQFKTVKQVIEAMQTQSVKEKIEKVSVEFQTEQQVHEAGLLTLDSTKAQKELNWKPVWDFQSTVEKTSQWYVAEFKKENMREKCLQQIEEYQKCQLNS